MSANDPGSGFPLQSLPYCVFAGEDAPHIGVGIGAFILDLNSCGRGPLLEDLSPGLRAACRAETLNQLIGCGTAAHKALRARLMEVLDSDAGDATREHVSRALVPMETAKLLKPVEPPNYTDFYASIHHATRVGRLFRPEQPLLPNYRYVPIGYHGRASSIVVSGTPIRRPCGQTKPSDGEVPAFGPTRFLDYEMEVALYVAEGNPLGEPVAIEGAEERIFGISLLNDWSARDIQAWEYQPLGPFLGKSFATSVSPWVVPMTALAPYRCPLQRPADAPESLPYLHDHLDQQNGAIDLTVEVYLLTPRMRAEGLEPHRLSRGNLREMYWTMAQLVAHHTSNGCNLKPGDVLATGTVSGEEESSSGCLLELTVGGRTPVVLGNGEIRSALEDGDEVILRGCCQRGRVPSVSLGECRGTVLPAKA